MVTTKGLAQGIESHVHGHAELNVALIGQQLQIEFVSPAMNLLGFERAPGSSEETTLLATATADLRTIEWLLGDALEQCQMSLLAFESPEFEDHSHEHGGHEDEEDDVDVDSHAEFHVQYLFDCPARPATEYRVNAFGRFSGIEEITVQWITEGQQGLAELTSGNPFLILE